MKVDTYFEEMRCAAGHLTLVESTLWRNKWGTFEDFDIDCKCGLRIGSVTATTCRIVSPVDKRHQMRRPVGFHQ